MPNRLSILINICARTTTASTFSPAYTLLFSSFAASSLPPVPCSYYSELCTLRAVTRRIQSHCVPPSWLSHAFRGLGDAACKAHPMVVRTCLWIRSAWSLVARRITISASGIVQLCALARSLPPPSRPNASSSIVSCARLTIRSLPHFHSHGSRISSPLKLEHFLSFRPVALNFPTILVVRAFVPARFLSLAPASPSMQRPTRLRFLNSFSHPGPHPLSVL